MKKLKFYILIMTFALLTCALLLVGCGKPPEEKKIMIPVVVEQTENVQVEQKSFKINRGDDVTVRFTVADGYKFTGCNYEDYELITSATGTSLLLKKVDYALRLRITTDVIVIEPPAPPPDEPEIEPDPIEQIPAPVRGIKYFINGGSFIDGRAGDSFYVPFDASHHLRANTSIGTDIIYRKGYTQTGWNGKPDGTGEHIGLGSRATVNEGCRIDLYAEWEKWNDASEFEYADNTHTDDPDDISLRSFTGSKTGRSLVIPAEIDGRKVTAISTGFCYDLKTRSLVLPHTIGAIYQGAFMRMAVKKIYVYDSLKLAMDASFGMYVAPKVYINAIQKPAFLAVSDHSQFAEAMDRIILNANKKKMIFFSGCSMGYGLRSGIVNRRFNNEYVICNVGVLGGTNAIIQMNCITKFLGKDDILIHAPETMSEYQFFASTYCDARMYRLIEGNYDLLSYADMTESKSFWLAFANYNASKDKDGVTFCTYDTVNPHYNAYGDYIVERPYTGEVKSFGQTPMFDLAIFENGKAIERMNKYYGAAEDKGATVYVSYAPANRAAMTDVDDPATFSAILEEGLDPRFEIISKIEDYIFEGDMFYDSDYHLNDNGARKRTVRLLQDLTDAMKPPEGEEA